jgi:rhodanese-related sulfurtransferase
MKRLTIVISAILLVFVGVVFFAYNNKTNKSVADNTKTVEVIEKEPATLSDEIKAANGQLIDVREPSEYETSHADNAINIPLGDILKADYSKIDSSRPIYLICRSGNRAEQAKTALEQAGFTNVKNIGGLIDWEKQGDKVCSTSTPSCS